MSPDHLPTSGVRDRVLGAKDFLLDRKDGFLLKSDELEEMFEAMLDSTIKTEKATAASETPEEVKDSNPASNGTNTIATQDTTPSKSARALINPKNMQDIGHNTGTHSVKIVRPRANGEKVLMIEGYDLYYFCDAKLAPLAKILFKPFLVEGANAPTSIAQSAAFGGGFSARILTAASNVMGAENIAMFVAAMTSDKSPSHVFSELPVVFLPNPADEGKSDIQITPLSPAQAYNTSREKSNRFFLKDEKNKQGETVKRQRRAAFVQNAITGSPQNISSMIGGQRAVICADFPNVMDGQQAALMAHAIGSGPVPRLRDDTFNSMALTAIRLHAALEEQGRVPALVQAFANTARAMANMAAFHMTDVFDSARDISETYSPARRNVDTDVITFILKSVFFEGEADKVDSLKSAFRSAAGHKVFRDAAQDSQSQLDANAETLNQSSGEPT